MSTIQSGAGETRPQRFTPNTAAYQTPANQPSFEQTEASEPVKLEYKPVGTGGKPVHGIFKKISRIQLGIRPLKPGKKGYGYFYVPLDQLMNALNAPFREMGLVVTSRAQAMPAGANFPGMYFTTTLTDLETGEHVESTHVIPPLTNPQDLGKWETYLRRYSLIALLGICAETDTDGANPRPQTSRRYQQRG